MGVSITDFNAVRARCEKNRSPGKLKQLAADIVKLHMPDAAPVKTKHKSKSYNETVVSAFFAEHGIPKPEFEFQFHESRKWRFDLAFCQFLDSRTPKERKVKVAIEVDGGIWIRGGHNRGAQMKKDWEKRNTATSTGWKIIMVEPCDLCTMETAALIKKCLGI